MSEATRRGALPLDVPNLIILSGTSGSGKTRLCDDAAGLARKHGLVAAGLITRSAVAGGRATKVVCSVRSGEERLLGRFVHATGDPLIEHWRFNDEGMAWGEQELRDALPCDVLIVDEIGPLELIYGRGWSAAIGVLLARRCRLAVVSVRPLLLTDLSSRLAAMNPVTLSVNHDNYPDLLAQLEQWIEAIHDSR